MTAALSNTLTQKDVAEVVVEVLCEELRARRGLRFVSRRGSRDAESARLARVSGRAGRRRISLETDTPETGAVRGEGWQLHTSEDVDPNLESKGDVSYAVAPWSPGGNA